MSERPKLRPSTELLMRAVQASILANEIDPTNWSMEEELAWKAWEESMHLEELSDE